MQTISGGSFTLDATPGNTTAVSLNQQSVYQVGNNAGKANISDMSTVHYIAVVFKSSSTKDVPQSQFGTPDDMDMSNYRCLQVSCSGSSCNEVGGSAPYGFTMKSEGNAAVGDYAEGGVIACLNGGLNDLVVQISDQSSTIKWGGQGTTTSATSTTDGATNTITIVNCLTFGTGDASCSGSSLAQSSYAAGICDDSSISGGYASGWFLPAVDNSTLAGQLNCLYTNRTPIETAAEAAGGSPYSNRPYWSSTEFSDERARDQDIDNSGNITIQRKDNFPLRTVRCTRSISL